MLSFHYQRSYSHTQWCTCALQYPEMFVFLLLLCSSEDLWAHVLHINGTDHWICGLNVTSKFTLWITACLCCSQLIVNHRDHAAVPLRPEVEISIKRQDTQWRVFFSLIQTSVPFLRFWFSLNFPSTTACWAKRKAFTLVTVILIAKDSPVSTFPFPKPAFRESRLVCTTRLSLSFHKQIVSYLWKTKHHKLSLPNYYVTWLHRALNRTNMILNAPANTYCTVFGHRNISHHWVQRMEKKGAGREEDVWKSLTLVHVIIGHDDDTLLPHHADVSPIAVTGPEEHGQQDGLGDGAPQHTQHHPVVGALKLQTGKAHHLHSVGKG